MGFNDTVRNVTVQLSCKHNGESVSYGYNNELKELTLERIAEGKFFGVTVAQKLNVKLINSNNDILLQAGDEIQPWFYSGEDIKAPNRFYITEIHKDENTNELSITAYDAIYFISNYTFGDLGTGLTSISDILAAIPSLVPTITSVSYSGVTDRTAFNYVYSGDNQINIEPTENLRNVLTQICEATQTIAYMAGYNLYFQRLLPNDTFGATIDKSKYFKLSSKENRRLVGIVSTTELGDNVGEQDVVSGTIAYVNENGFWNYTNDIGELVHNAYTLENGLTIGQFEMEWRGNPTIDYGTKLKIEDKQGNYFYSYLLDDVITYNGSYKQKTKWIYNDQQTTQYNAASIGDALSRANARVDKVNGRISLEVNDLQGQLADINIQQNSIESRVYNIENAEPDTSAVDQLREDMNNAFNDLSNQYLSTSYTQQIQDAYSWALSVNQEFTNKDTLEKSLKTTTALIDEDGITVSTKDSPTRTNINENGMKVMYNNTVELEANSQGVTAHNLSADNYLIIDGLIRFEKYQRKNDNTIRCGCFWIGG